MSQTNDQSQNPLIKPAEERKDPTPAEQMAKFTGESTVRDEPAKEPAKKPEENEEVVENKEETAAEKADKATDTDESAESGADAPDDKPKKKKSVEERIAELKENTYHMREAERRAKEAERRAIEAEARLAALEGKKSDEDLTTEKPDPKSELKAPDPNNYEYGEFDTKYRQDHEKYLRDSIRAEIKADQEAARAKDEDTRQAQAAAAQQQELAQKRDAAIEEGIKEFDDFEDALSALDEVKDPIAPETAAALLESEHCHRILHHLGKNPTEAAEMAKKTPLEQARYLGRLEAKFSAEKAASTEKPKPKTSQAPEPPSNRARGANGQFTPNDATTDFTAFKERHAGKGF